MGGHHRVVIDIDHAHVGSHPLGQLVHVGRGGQAAAEVQELPDALVPGQVPHRPAEERPVVARDRRHVRDHGDKPLGRLPVGGEVVLTAEQVVVDPGHVRRPRIDAARPQVQISHLRHLH
jgi:hypothetical protein